MLHLLRKHQYGILLIVAIIVIVAFAFFYDPNYRRQAQGGMKEGRPLKVLDTTFPPEEVENIKQTYDILPLLASGYGDSIIQHRFTMVSLSRQVVERDLDPKTAPKDFIINTALVRAQCRKLGIHASEAECDERIQSLPRFQDPKTTKFDPAAWSNFKNAYGGEAGARIRVVYAAVADTILFDKLFALVGHEVPPSKTQIDWSYATQYQIITAHVVPILKKNYENQEVTEEEIKKYFEENKESPELQSEERRSLHYALMAKPADEQLKDLTDAQKEEKNKEYKKTAKDFADRLAEDERKPFAEIAKELNVEVKTTPAFTQSAPPEEWKSEARTVTAAFNIPEAGQAELIEGDKGYYAIEVAAIEPPKPLEFDQARGKIEKLLKEKKQTEKFTEAVAGARDKLKAELEAGHTVVEAAQAAGVEVKELPPFSQMKPLKDEPNYRQILSAAATLDAGALSEPLNTPDGQILVFVAKKELPKDPKMEDQKKAIASRLGGFAARRAESNPVFLAWFSDLKKRAVADMGRA
jgi:hypothetical protein